MKVILLQDEVTLPGLGVFLEIIWENADNELKAKY